MKPFVAFFLSGCAFLFASAIRGAEVKTWAIVAETSQVDFGVKATADSFTGHLAKSEAQVTSTEEGKIAEATITFRVADLKTGKNDRDEQLLTRLDATNFPTATFVLKTLVSVGAQLQATADFTLHGMTRSISFPVTLGDTGPRHTIDCTAMIDHREWGLKVIHKFALLKVDPVVKETFHLEANAP